MNKSNVGQVRVGRITGNGNKKVKPTYKGFTVIEVMTKSSPYGMLGPYELKDEKGRIVENVHQFSKLYPKVPKHTETYSQWDRTVVWDHPAETHVNVVDDDYEILPEYWEWREKGMNNPYKVRYPVGKVHSRECIGAIRDEDIDNDEIQLLNYIEARKEIYVKVYLASVTKHPEFAKLKKRLEKGENLLIIEVDGPHGEALDYYIKKYNVKKDFIKDNTILATEKNLNIVLNDKKFSFGHGYVLAAALQEIELK